MKKAAILIADGFEEIEALVPFDLLKRAGIVTVLVNVENKKLARGNNGLIIETPTELRGYDFETTDALIVPGGDAYAVFKNIPLIEDEIRAFAMNPQKVLGAICAGSALAGELGVYKNKKYVCVPSMNEDSFGGTFEKKHAVVDGNIVSGISVGGAFEFAFALIEKLADKHKAEELKKAVAYTL